MTLEQTTRRILAAADMQDLQALQAAGEMRQEALDALHSTARSTASCNDVAASIAAGEKAQQALRIVKHRLRNESRRLSHIEDGFMRALLPTEKHQVDCKG
jgi:signal transduction protein with GAF and PtsI domain